MFLLWSYISDNQTDSFANRADLLDRRPKT